MATPRVYRTFYLEGRDDVMENGVDANVDLGLLADAILDGKTMHEATHKAAKDVLAASHNAERRQWVEDHATEIAGAGGNSTLAFEEWMAGRTDEFRVTIEEEVILAMRESMDAAATPAGDEEENGDDDEDEEDEDDGDEEDDDDDDEDEDDEEEEDAK